MANIFNSGILPAGGAKVSGAGGFIAVAPVGKTARNALHIAGSSGNTSPLSAPFDVNAANRIDVALWKGRMLPENEDTTDSGSFGFRSETRVCLGFEAQLALALDLAHIAELKLQNGSGVQLYLKIGDRFLFYPDSIYTQKWIYVPRFLLNLSETTNESTKAVKYNAAGRGTGVFLLPDENAAANVYITYLMSRGWDGP